MLSWHKFRKVSAIVHLLWERSLYILLWECSRSALGPLGRTGDPEKSVPWYIHCEKVTVIVPWAQGPLWRAGCFSLAPAADGQGPPRFGQAASHVLSKNYFEVKILLLKKTCARRFKQAARKGFLPLEYSLLYEYTILQRNFFFEVQILSLKRPLLPWEYSLLMKQNKIEVKIWWWCVTKTTCSRRFGQAARKGLLPSEYSENFY